jgi:hypothetical protein
MPRAELPQRIPLDRSAAPVADYGPPPIELVERVADAIHEWAAQTPRCRSEAPSGIGDTTSRTRPEDVTR